MTAKVLFNLIWELREVKEKLGEGLKNIKLPIYPPILVSTQKFITFLCDEYPTAPDFFYASNNVIAKIQVNGKDYILFTILLYGTISFEVLVFASEKDEMENILRESFEKNKFLNVLLGDVVVFTSEAVRSRVELEEKILKAEKLTDLSEYLHVIVELCQDAHKFYKTKHGRI